MNTKRKIDWARPFKGTQGGDLEYLGPSNIDGVMWHRIKTSTGKIEMYDDYGVGMGCKRAGISQDQADRVATVDDQLAVRVERKLDELIGRMARIEHGLSALIETKKAEKSNVANLPVRAGANEGGR